MAKIVDVIKGINILSKYDANGNIVSTYESIVVRCNGFQSTSDFLFDDVIDIKKSNWYWDADMEGWTIYT